MVKILASFSLLFLAGCAGLPFLSSEADIQPMGSGFMATISSSLPAGIYTLEHVDGILLSRGVADPRRGLTPNKRMIVGFDVNVRALPEPSACLRIRRPDGKLLEIGASGQTQLRLPSLEAAYIQTIEIPELNTAERLYSRNVQIVAETNRWIATSPAELGPNRVCRVPIPNLGVCSTDSMARHAAQSSCMASVVTCTGAGALGETIASQWSDRKQGATALIGALSSGACQAAINVGRGDRVEWWPLVRDLFIDLSAQSLLRSLTNDNPSVEAQLATTAAVAAISYENCLDDAVAQCRQQSYQQQRFSRRQYNTCNARMAQYRQADYLISTYHTPTEIRNQLQLREAQLKRLTTTTILRRAPEVIKVQSCY